MKKKILILSAGIIIILNLFGCREDITKRDLDKRMNGINNETKKILKENKKTMKIDRVKSNIDFNGNGVDDYGDFLEGGKIEAKNKPRYNGKYWEGGYPPEEIGVCTDVIWRAMKHGGYDLKAMMDKDIANFPQDYPDIQKPDPNIDFRRVKNQHAFFKKYAENLTIDINEIEAWQPGDIVIFRDDYHIGLISDIRNKDGVNYIIHNLGQRNREEEFFAKEKPIAHFRFNAENIDPDILIPWND